MSPKEFFAINILMVSIGAPPLLTLRSAEALGKMIPVMPTRLFPAWARILLLTVFFLGVLAAIYIIIQAIGWFAALAGTGPR